MQERYIKDDRLNKIVHNIAENAGTNVEDVLNAMQEALIVGYDSSDPTIQDLWKQIPRKGKIPTPEEFIIWATNKIQQQRDA